ncbi:MAG: hypothetical protein M0D55_03905 [Elusimicrobiota bacterium]|nr:MAG: hypothetical protein M0D55_03905 [Elusimicrobiota bacterium]
MTPLRTPLSASGISPAPAAGERRSKPRTIDVFPVTLEPADRRFKASVNGSTRDYDEAGACVRARKSLPVGAKVKVRLLMPRTMSEFFRGMRIEFHAHVAAVRPARGGTGTRSSSPGTSLCRKWWGGSSRSTRSASGRP